MNSEERLKKNLEDLLALKEFPFDKANWEKAQQLMASEEAFMAALEESLSSKEFPFDKTNWEKAQVLMASEETFKTSLEDSLNSKEFPFDEQNWLKAAKMIRAEERPRRVAFYFLGGLLLLGTLLTGFYLFNSFSSEEQKSISIPTNKVKPHVEEFIETPKTKADPKSQIPKPVIEAIKPFAKTAKINTPPDLTQIKKSSLVKADIQTPASTISPDKKSNSTPVVNVSSAPIVVTPDKRETESSEAQQPSKQSSTYNVEPIEFADSASATVEVMKKQAPTGHTTIIDEKEESTEKSENTSASLATNTPPITPIENSKNPEETKEINFTGALNETFDKPQAVEKDSLGANVNELLGITEKTNESEKEATTSANSDSIKIAELTSELPEDNDQGELGRPKEYPVLISVEAGADYLNGWKNSDSRDARSVNLLFGINYFTNIQHKMDLSIGLHYTSVSNLSSSNYTSRVTRLGFGEESTVTIFTPVKLHYLLIPMRFNYCLTPLNTIGIGFNLGYLLTVDSEIETYTEKFNTKSNQELSKARGYTEGFKKYDSQLSLFYKRRLYPKLAINVEAFVGLADIKDNQFFNSNVFERNTGLKLTLVYNFLRN
jgi:hypothetical protein